MPEVDFMIICDHVRVDNGLAHIIAAGVDRIYSPSVPTARQLGVVIHISMTRAECEAPHKIRLIFQSEDGRRLVEIAGTFGANYDVETVPLGWPAYVFMPFNIGLPIPAYGTYSFELLIDDNTKKSIPVLVAPPPALALAKDANAPQDE